MSEAKHTPGPWLIAKTDAASFVYALNDSGYNRFWAHVIGGKLRRGKSTSKVETEANARLIAAAPDLLEALVAIDNALRTAWSNGSLPDSVIPEKLAQQCSAAIAKATGKTQ